MTRDALAEGRSAQEILTEGLIAGMSVVGEDFKHNVLYVPEVLIAARAMKAGNPTVEKTSSPVRPRLFGSWPGRNSSGTTPMPIRFERWMRS